MGQFGDKFRKAREAKELTFDDVSNVTKVGPRMLQAIEEENFDRLPGGVFNKGFIRAYAKHLGLNPEDAITEYLECLHQAQIAAQQAWEPVAQTEVRSVPPVKAPKEVSAASQVAVSRPTTPVAVGANKPAAKARPQVEVEELPELRVPPEGDLRPPAKKIYTPAARTESPWRLVVVAALIFILGIVLWTRRSHTASPQPTDSNSALTNSSSAPPATATPADARAQSPSAAATASAPAASPAALSHSSPSNSQSLKPSGPITPAPAPAASPNSPSAPNTIEDKNDVTIRTFGKPAPVKTTEAAADSFTLVIRATENSWLSVVADGQIVRQETLIAPAHTSIHASREIVVKLGNAAGVSFVFNGKEISPQGNEAEAKTLVFDSSGLKTTP
ncbi:MAG TPA: helix-turn-helix domain-containing protein [Candidatus Sulfotelmatobacter sp.]|jgi:cytoskeletal protein RodZ|nr:helix-turn-helix domain-containing protein [Candidatus Sulfotelmatobacter sp.]